MYKSIISWQSLHLSEITQRKLYSPSSYRRLLWKMWGFQMAAMSLTGLELQLLRDNSQREKEGYDNYLELSQLSQHIKIHLINYCLLLPRWLSPRENKSGSYNETCMYVWCVLCHCVNRLTDLISGEVVAGEVCVHTGCHTYAFFQTHSAICESTF